MLQITQERHCSFLHFLPVPFVLSLLVSGAENTQPRRISPSLTNKKRKKICRWQNGVFTSCEVILYWLVENDGWHPSRVNLKWSCLPLTVRSGQLPSFLQPSHTNTRAHKPLPPQQKLTVLVRITHHLLFSSQHNKQTNIPSKPKRRDFGKVPSTYTFCAPISILPRNKGWVFQDTLNQQQREHANCLSFKHHWNWSSAAKTFHSILLDETRNSTRQSL